MFAKLAVSGRKRKQSISMLLDALFAVICLWGAYSLRYNQPFSDFQNTWHFFLIVPFLTVFSMFFVGVYRWVVRSTDHALIFQLLKASSLAGLLLLITFTMLPADRVNPRSIFIIFGLMLFTATTSARVLWKYAFQMGSKGEPIAIYGAGAAGQRLASLLSADSLYRPVLLIDDNPDLAGTTLCGLPVCDPDREDFKDQLFKFDVCKIVLAMPRLRPAEIHRKLRLLEPYGIKVLTTPGIEELISGRARPQEIRDITISDILNRAEVSGNLELMGRRVAGKVVLVTGGGGSIGSEISRQALQLKPERLIVLDNSEANLYQITEELTQLVKAIPENCRPVFIPRLGSVLDAALVNRVLRENKVDTVFHAAAYKHVPIVEAQPEQGVAVNVFGTKTLLECALLHGVSDFLLISTDKAVRPTNAMGASKRVAELVLQAWAATDTRTRISMVRFGNVLGSSGSVVPKFKRQILNGGPVTLTHSEVTRYFMSIPEAAQLVLQASAIAKGGEVFVLDMGEPVRIEELAVTMIKLYGKNLQRETGDPKDIEIIVNGLRPGEKLHEELFLTKHNVKTSVEKITAAKEAWLDRAELESQLKKLQANCEKADSVQLKRLLMKLAFITRAPVDEGSSLSNSDITLTVDRKEARSEFETVEG